MFKATIKDLWARKLRLFSTSAAVVLGVAFMCGTLVFTDTVGKTFDELFTDLNEDTDAYVRGQSTVDSDFGDLRPRVDASLLDDVASVDGVADAYGDIFGYAQIVGANGDPLGNPGFGPPTAGVIWDGDSDDEFFRLVDGRGPETADEAVIDVRSAGDGNLSVGDTITILVPEPVEVTLVGTVGFGEFESPGGATIVGMIDTAAQDLFAEPGKYDGIILEAEDGVSQDELVSRVAAVTPDGTEVITGAQVADENKDSIEQGLGFFQTILLVFAGIALFVGSFIIYNTFGIIVAQRTKELALLRAIGASRKQVMRSVLLEATFVGVIASAVGLVVGIGVSIMLKNLLSAAGLEMPSGGVVVTTATILTAFVVGVGMSISSAYFPARRGSRVSPLAAMRDVAVEKTHASKVRIGIGLGAVVLGVVALLTTFLSDEGSIQVVILGAFLTMIGVIVLGPVIARPVTSVLGSPLPRLKGMTGVLARENASRNPKRSASTAAALMIGVTLVGFITVFASSAQKSVNKLVDDQFVADVIVQNAGGGFGGGGFSPELAADIDSLDGVDVVSSMRFTGANVDETATFMMGISTNIGDLYDFGLEDGDVTELADDGMAVNLDYAEENSLAIGDTIDVEFVEGGSHPFEVRAIYTDKLLAGSYFVGLEAFDLYAPDQFDSNVFVLGDDSVPADELLASIETAAEPYPTAEVLDIAGFKESQAASFSTLINIIYGLLFLAIFIALLGIANTLALSIHERTRELGLLRAVGMTRSQVRSAIRWESVLIALLGTALGLTTGLFFGWAMAQGMRSEGFTEFSIPFMSLFVICVLAAVAGVVAAVWPARKASRLNILQAIATD
jgi:putative ABC transport system permease protein